MRSKLRLRGNDSPFSIRRRTKTNPSVYDSHSFLFFTHLPSIFPFSYLRTFQTQGKTIFDTPIYSCPDACSVLCLPLDRWFFVFHRFSLLLRFTAASSFRDPLSRQRYSRVKSYYVVQCVFVLDYDQSLGCVVETLPHHRSRRRSSFQIARIWNPRRHVTFRANSRAFTGLSRNSRISSSRTLKLLTASTRSRIDCRRDANVRIHYFIDVPASWLGVRWITAPPHRAISGCTNARTFLDGAAIDPWSLDLTAEVFRLPFVHAKKEGE